MSRDVHHGRDVRASLDSSHDGPYVYRSMLPSGTWRERRLSRKKLVLLERIDAALRPMLAEGERVYFITRGSLVSTLEWFLLGWVMFYLNRRAIVLTDRRILLVQITSRGHPRPLRSQIDYGSLERVALSLLGNARVRFRDGSTRTLAYVPRADRRFLRDGIDRLGKALGGERPPGGNVRSLCPHCFAPAAVDQPRCQACRGQFKSPRHAALLSLLFPGAGDLYLGHRAFATMEILGAAFVWIMLLVVAWNPAGTPPAAFVALFALTVPFIHGVDAVATRHIARTGLYPASGTGGMNGRLAAAALVPVAVLLLAAVPVTQSRGLTPIDLVLDEEAMPERQIHALHRAGHLDPDETLLGFYSSGMSSILETGALFTDRRVVAYRGGFVDGFVAAASYDRIHYVHHRVVSHEPAFAGVTVLHDDDRWFFFILPVADGQDRRSYEALRERWRSARERAGEGVWFDGGGGTSAEDAVIIRGLAPGADATAEERRWLTAWLGEEGRDWEWRERSRMVDGGRTVDRVAVLSEVVPEESFYFLVPDDG